MLQNNPSSGSRENEIKARGFQPQLSRGRTNYSYKAADYSQGLARRDASLRREESAYMQSFARNAKIAEENAMMMAQDNGYKDLQALSRFSKTLTSFLTETGEQIRKDKEVAETWDAVFGTTLDGSIQTEAEYKAAQQEAEGIRNIDDATAQVTQLSNEVEADTNDPAMGAAVRNAGDPNGVSRGLRQSRGNIMSAAAGYSAYMTTLLNSDEVIYIDGQRLTFRQATALGDARINAQIMAYAQQRFISDHGLAGASKALMVELLVPTVLSANARISQNLAQSGVTQQREQQQASLADQSYNIAQTSPTSELGNNWRASANRYWTSGAYATRGAANEAALKDYLRGLVSRGDVEAIQALRAELKDPNNAGSQLGRQYSELFDAAERDAAQAARNNEQNQSQQVESDMYRQLASAQTAEERMAIVGRAADRLEALGQYRAARQLRQQASELGVSGGSDFNYAQYSQGIRNGEITTPEQIQQAQLRGDIDATQARNLLSQLESLQASAPSSNPELQPVFEAQTRRAAAELETRAGIQRTPDGRYVALPGQTTQLMSPSAAAIILPQMEAEQTAYINTGLRGQNLSGTALRTETNRLAQEWYQQNVLDPSGKYYIDPNWANLPPVQRDAYARDRKQYFSDLSNSPVALSRPRGISQNAGRSQDLTDVQSWSSANADLYNPVRGDKLFDSAEILRMSEAYRESGELPENLVSMATTFGYTPLALLNQQRAAYGAAPLTPPSIYQQDRSRLRNGDQESNGGDIRTPLGGARALMSMGFPANGAAFLSGNIQQESGWYGQRTWGEVMGDGSDRNGGLVSWMDGVAHNNFRLTRIEQHLGKPISQASDYEQLEAMRWEMRTYYPEAYRIFNNPQSTERQLIRASRLYWGYGHEGSRYDVARSVREQL